MNQRLFVLFALLLLTVGVARAQDSLPTQVILEQLNVRRADQGAPELRYDNRLAVVAQALTAEYPGRHTVSDDPVNALMQQTSIPADAVVFISWFGDLDTNDLMSATARFNDTASAEYNAFGMARLLVKGGDKQVYAYGLLLAHLSEFGGTTSTGAVSAGDTLQPDEIISVVNSRRAELNLPALVYDPKVATVADTIAQTVVATGDYPDDDVENALSAAGVIVTGMSLAGWHGSGDSGAFANVLRNEMPDLVDAGYTSFGLGRAAYPSAGLLQGSTYAYVAILIRGSTCNPGNQESVPGVQLDQATQMLNRVNQARAQQGLPSLTLNNGQLYAAARWYSDDMKAHGYPAERASGEPHIGTDGSDPGDRVTRSGYVWSTVRENILYQYRLDAAEAFDSWWTSPHHQENILGNDITEMAVAFTCDPATGKFFYTQVFASPAR